ncbi:MAG: dipeptidase [Ignavibacterium album]|jgi:membrane dipeptidase|uniref:dipeptidase n=1 Tax=Ignavibacterium album TaxID=591197 RepID=UPI0026ED8AC3|nr:dipeptidase [Ignavibacterium album]MCX8106254.1 dipeptidase [Ignavibacterium album]
MKLLSALVIFLLSITLFGQDESTQIDFALMLKANRLAKEILIVDTHIDLPDWLYDEWFDISQKTNVGEFDFERANEGGLNVAFMSVYTSPRLEAEGKSKFKADSLISIVERIEQLYPDKIKIVKCIDDVQRYKDSNKIPLALGMENGSPIESSLDNLREYYKKGIRYITLSHYKSNHICDSANDPERRWNGLSPFGEEVIREMNKLGIMIDVSHISDSTFYDVMRLSKAPVIASHSCCRFFTPGFERNISDEMIVELAKKGGVVQIAFAGFFLREDINKKYLQGEEEIKEHLKNFNITPGTDSAWQYESQYWKENPVGRATVEDVADHIDHIVKLVGVDYVGIGSDFNGVGDQLPIGLEDASKYPNLIYVLLKRGYAEKDIRKIFGKNLIRVWKEVEKVSDKLK